MRDKQKTTGMIRLVWSLLIGLGMAMGLLWTVVPRPSVEAQAFSPGPVIGRDEGVAAVPQPSADVLPAPALSNAPAKSGAAPLSASLGDGFGARAQPLAPLAPPLPGDNDLAVCMTTDRVWGVVGSGETVTVAVNGAQMGASLADDNGFFWTPLYDSGGDHPDLGSGDTVAVYHDSTLSATVTLRAITGTIDLVNDVVSGIVGGAGFPISVTVYAPGGEPSMTSYSQTVSTDGSGSFMADFAGIWDFIVWNEAAVAYVEGGVEAHRHVYANAGLLVRSAPWNDVMGRTAPGTTVTATVYLSDTTERISTTLLAHAMDGWFRWDVPTDVLESDVVAVEMASGAVMSRTVEPLSLDVDTANDRVTGEAASSAIVRGSAGDLGPLGWYNVQVTTTADASGVFTLEFSTVADVLPGQWVGVYVADAEGDDLNLFNYAPSVEVHQTWNDVSGNGPTPPGPLSEGRPVTLTVYSAASDATSDYVTKMDWYGWYGFNEKEHGLPDIGPGDVVTVEAVGYAWQGVVEVMTITVQHDASADQFSGTVEPPTDRVELSGWQWGNEPWKGRPYPVGGLFDTLTTAASPFVAAPVGFDVRNGVGYDVNHRTDDELLERISRQVDWVEVRPSDNGLEAVLYPPGTAFTITLTDGGGGQKAQLNGFSDDPIGETGWQDFWDSGETIEVGDHVQVQGDNGFSQTIDIPDIIVSPDADNDLISGQGPANTLLYFDVEDQGEGFVPTDVDGQFVVAVDQLQGAWGDGDLQQGDGIRLWYLDENNNRVRSDVRWAQVRIDANYAHDWVQVETLPDATVAVTVAGGGDKATVAGEADQDGWFRSNDWSWDPEQPDIAPGDVITASAIGISATVAPVGTIDGVLDLDADTVSGTIHAAWFAPMTLTVECQVWTWGGPSIEIEGVDADGGDFFCDFAAEDWDLEPGPDVAVRYIEPDGDTVINIIQPRNLLMNVNYGHDWVENDYYEAGHTVWITVTESDGSTVKATAELTTQEIEWWGGGRIGFSTNVGDLWVPDRPDIQAGDWVYGRIDNGYTSTVRVGAINGELDMDADTISGTIHADWYTQTLHANCGVWEENGPGEDFDVDPDGGSYFCDFDAMGWDLQPGQDVGVEYQEPDGDWVINMFSGPAPDVRVEKWRPGGGNVLPGGPVVFTIRYVNHGDDTATTIWLTDTLPADTFYVTDTSGVAADVGPDWVAWTLGPLDPDEEDQFQIVLTNTASSGETLRNEVDVYTLYDSDDNNNHAESEVDVGDGQPDLRVNKHPTPNEPAAGETFLWEIDYSNDGPVASGPAVLTDTLPEDTSIVSWYSREGYELWTEVVSDADRLVLAAPTIPGNFGDRILLRLRVGAGVSPDTQLTNTVEITTAGDSDPDDNWDMNNDVWVREPRWNGSINKRFGRGQLVPGGEVEYHIRIGNDGNMPARTWVTDTLPAGTSFREAWIWTGSADLPWPPDTVDGEVVAWDVGVMEPGEHFDLNLRLDIGSSVTPGTVITNCAEITIDGDDGWPHDDGDCVVDTVRGQGANLRVYKEYEWNWKEQIRYEVIFENVGTQDLRNVWITDTYPISTSLENWWPDYHREITDTQYPSERQIVFWVEEIQSGDRGRANLEVRLDGGIVDEQGLAFTNEVEAPIVDDVYPVDNYGEVTAYTGPDVYVEKWLSGGEPRPGEIVTFTVEFGNASRGPWDGDHGSGSHITDTLPPEMTFITATTPWDPNQSWTPNILPGNVFEWGFGTMWADSWWRFDLVVRITDTVQGGDVVTNVIEAYGDSPDDVDPVLGNNVFKRPVTILHPRFEIGKAYESSHVAGDLVTYTITVTNVGTEVATGVIVSDVIPSYLTTVTVGGGTLQLPYAWWVIGPIAADGGTATAEFSAVLPPTAGLTITNDTYYVVTCDQGVSSTLGAPVSFEVLPADNYVYLPLVMRSS